MSLVIGHTTTQYYNVGYSALNGQLFMLA